MQKNFVIEVCGKQIFISAPEFIYKVCGYLRAIDSQIPFDILRVAVISRDGKMLFVVSQCEKEILKKVVEEKKALFFFFVLLEQLISERMTRDTLCFHGGVFAKEDQAYMVVEKKGAGKTTLVAKMSSFEDFSYRADDLVLCNDKYNVISLPLPMRLRNIDIPNINLNGCFLGKCEDFQGVTRHLFLPNSWKLETARLCTVILPEYVPECEADSFTFERVDGGEKVKKLIMNVKEIMELHDFYSRILGLANEVTMYRCRYSGNIDFVAEKLSELLT